MGVKWSLSKETKEKIRQSKLGSKNPMYGKSGKDSPRYGIKHTDEIKQKLREAQLGRTPSKETREKQREAKLAELNSAWKGDDVGCNALHAWIKRNLPKPKLCQMCNKVPPYDLANITDVYNRDFINWKYICRKCHMISDGRLEQLLKICPKDHIQDPITGRFKSIN